MTVVRDSVRALYVQIAEAIEQKIRDGRHPPSTRLPSEQALMEEYGVSRVTVRQAVGVLSRKGLVEKKQGKGSFVTGPMLQHGIDRLMGFYDALIEQGEHPKTRLLAFRSATAGERARSAFAASTDVGMPMLVERLYLLRGRPFAIVRGLMTPLASRVTRVQVERTPIYGIVTQHLGLTVAQADVGVRARPVGKVYGELLKLPARRPVLVMERLSRTLAGSPIEHSQFFVDPESYEVRLSVSGPLEIGAGIRRVAVAPAAPARPRATEGMA